MKIVKKPLSWITPSELNSRKHPENQINEFVRSIEKFDVIRPIVTDENGRVLVGHGLLMALQKMGRDTADVMIMSGLSEKEKKKLVLSDNKIYSLGIDNYYNIEEMLKEIASEGDFDVPGYNADILDEMYGIKSVEKSTVQHISPTATIEADVGFVQQKPIEPSKKMKEEREKAVAEAGKFVICPFCGERIDM